MRNLKAASRDDLLDVTKHIEVILNPATRFESSVVEIVRQSLDETSLHALYTMIEREHDRPIIVMDMPCDRSHDDLDPVEDLDEYDD